MYSMNDSLLFFVKTRQDLKSLLPCVTTVYYRPYSEASEGYVFTGVCHSVTEQVGCNRVTYPSG